MTDLMPFSNGEFQLDLRPHEADGFHVAAPGLARALGFREAHDLLRSIPQEEKGSELVRTPGGEQRVGYLTEAGFYRALGQRQAARIPDESLRASVERFQSWVYGEVLPTIRKTGGYGGVERLTPLGYARQLVVAEERAELERARALVAEAQIEAERPMVERAKTHAGGEGLKTRQQFFREVKQWGHAERGIEVRQAHVVEFLSTRKLGIFVRGNRSDAGQATAWAIEHGYAVNVDDTAKNGHNFVTGKLTPPGQQYAWDRVVRYIDANGTLELPRQIGGAA